MSRKAKCKEKERSNEGKGGMEEGLGRGKGKGKGRGIVLIQFTNTPINDLAVLRASIQYSDSLCTLVGCFHLAHH